nr:hypothetical protein [Priestia aryabhattai]MDH3130290.1 hypothetical protein [Priestia aryabhattai]
MKQHGKRAFISHLIPTVTLIIIAVTYYLSAKVEGANTPNSILVSSCTILISLITMGVIIWNIKQGIKQLRS